MERELVGRGIENHVGSGWWAPPRESVGEKIDRWKGRSRAIANSASGLLYPLLVLFAWSHVRVATGKEIERDRENWK